MPIIARDDIIVVSEGLLGLDDLFEDNNFGPDVDAVEIVSVDIGGGPQAVGSGTFTADFDLGVLSVGAVGMPGQNIAFDAGSGYDFLSFGETRDATFTYTARDASGATDTATVTIRVFGLNDMPDAVDDAYGTPGNPPSPLAEDVQLAANVLVNDTDVDLMDVLSVTAVNGGGIGGPITLSRGTLNISANGDFTYDYTGQNLMVGETYVETFDYTITDSAAFGALSDTATVTITVTGVNSGPIAVDDAYMALEDVVLNEDVTPGTPGQDSDPDNDPFTVTLVNGLAISSPITLTSGAIVTMNADGTFAYDQNGAFNGLAVGATALETFTYTIDDGNGGTDQATVTITITGANDFPMAVNDDFVAMEDVVLTGVDVTPGTPGQDSDPDGDVLTVTLVNGMAITGPITLASGAIVVMNGDGTFSYDQNGAFNSLAVGATGIDTFDYTIDDGNGGTDTATVTITINGANDAPDAVDDAYDVNENAVLSDDVTPGTPGQDSDPDNDPFTVTLVNGIAIGAPITLASGAIVTMNPDGTFDYDQNGAFDGLPTGTTATDSFTYTIDDGNGGTDQATVTITITGVNGPPVAIDDDFMVDEDAPLMGNVTPGTPGQDSDPDGDAFTVTLVNGQPTTGPITLPSGAIITMNPDGTFSYDQNGAFDSLPAGATDTDTFTYTIDDGMGGTDQATVTITINGVNDAPDAVDDMFMVGEGAALSDDVTPGTPGQDSDPDNDPFTVTLVNGIAIGAPITLASGAIITMNPDGTFDYDQNGAFDGLPAGMTATDSFDYTIDDGNGGTDTATVAITITGENDPPVAVDDDYMVDEDAPFTADVTPGTPGQDSDPDGDAFTVTLVNGQPITGPITLASGAVIAMGPDGTFSYNQNGAFDSLPVGMTATETFTYTIDDGNGGTDQATVTITINGVNDAPDAVDDAYMVGEGAALSDDVTPGTPGQDSDPDGDAFTVTLVNGQPITGPITLASGAMVTMNPDGTFDYDQNDAFMGLMAGATATDTFDYTIDDGNGGTDTATVTITITGENDPPVAVDDDFMVDEDAPLMGNVTPGTPGQDSDPDGDAFTVTLVNGQPTTGPITLPSGAIITMNPDGTFSYDQNGAFDSLPVGMTDTDTFTYTIDDGNGGTDQATVTITINGVNDAPDAVDDMYMVGEGAALSDDVTPGTPGQDSDPDNDPFTVTLVNGMAIGAPITLASGAIVTMNADGTFDYDQNDAFMGLMAGMTATDTFDYTIDDGNGGTDTATVTITITGENDPPVAVDDDFTVDEDAPLMGNVTPGTPGQDSDPDGDAFTVTLVNGQPTTGPITLPSGAIITMNPDGTFDYDQNGAFDSLPVGMTGTDTFTYTIDDGNGGTDQATVTITINGVNDAPDAVDDMYMVGEGAALSDDVTPGTPGQDSDPDNDPFTVTLVNGMAITGPITLASGAIVTMNPDGTFDYDQNDAFMGLMAGMTATDTFDYTIDDGNGGTDTATVTITITGENDPPVAVDDDFTVDEDAPLMGDVTPGTPGQDSDPDGDAFTVTLVNGQPTTGPITLPSGAIITMNPDGTFDYDQNGAFDSLPVGMTGTDTFTYTIDDGMGGTDQATVTITINGVNDAPDAVDDAYMVGEGAALTDDVTPGTPGQDSDPDNDPFTVTLVNGQPITGPITLASGAIVTMNPDGTFDYDQNDAFMGLMAGATATDTFDYTIDDGNGGTDTATVTITITGENDPPVAVDDDFMVDEDAPLMGDVTPGTPGQDSDPDGDAFTVTLVNGQPITGAITLPSGATVTMNPDGTFDYDQNGAFDSLPVGMTATETFTYTIDDGNGGTDQATVTITINGVNDAPDAVDDMYMVGEGAALSDDVTPGTPGQDSDPDNDPFTVTLVNGQPITGPITLASGAIVVMNPDGTFDYDQNDAFMGLMAGMNATDTFDYTIDDGNGGTDTATVTITITGENDPPVAVDDMYMVDEDAPFAADVTPGTPGQDSDPDGDAFTVTLVNGQPITGPITLPSGATVTMNPDGTFDYDQNGAYDSLPVGMTATETFTYTIDDGNGGTDQATVTITINGVNDAPDAVDDGFMVGEGAPLMGDVTPGTPGQDSDPDGDALTVTLVNGQPIAGVITLPSGAMVTMNPDGTFDYDQNDAFMGLMVGMTATDTFTYTITDGNGGTDTATVTITINGENDPPMAVDDDFTVDEDQPLNGDLTPGTPGQDSDPDGDPITVTMINGQPITGPIMLPSGATLTVNPDGTFSLDQNGVYDSLTPGEMATETFTYTIDDGNGGTDQATVTVKINGVNDAPDAVDDDFGVNEGAPLMGDVTPGTPGQDSDPDGDPIMVTMVNGQPIGGTIMLPSGATVVMNPDGTFEYDQNGAFGMLRAGEMRTDTFTYTISDGNGGTDSAVATVKITGVNAPPTAVDDDFAVQEDQPLNGDLTPGTPGQDSDPDGDPIMVTMVNGQPIGGVIDLPSGARITVNPDGSFNYDQNGAYDGLKVGEMATETFTYTIDDGNGGTDQATATIKITGVNDPPNAVDDSYVVTEDMPLMDDVTPGTPGQDSDPDGDPITVTMVNGQPITGPITLPSGAMITMNPDGTFTYSQNGAFENLNDGEMATESFTYTITDGNGGTDTATATIKINGVTDTPPDPGEILVGCRTLITFDLLNTVDSGGAPRSQVVYTVQSAPAMGATFFLNGVALAAGSTFTQQDIHEGLVSFESDPAGMAGAFDLVLTVTDSVTGVSAPFTFTITVADPQEVLIGTNMTDLLYGGPGDTRIEGLGGDDFLFGHDGDDCIDGGDGDDELYGHAGNDVIIGGKGNDLLDGNDGDDRLFGDDGDDMIWGNGGNDVVEGGRGNDSIAGGDGEDILYGNAGDDMICGNEGDDFIVGGVGNDELAGDSGNDVLWGGIGHDRLYGNDGDDTSLGGTGNDFLTGDYGMDRLFGELGNDRIHGGEDNDYLDGGAGHDRICGDGGDDMLIGGSGNDEIHGGEGRDTLLGGEGNDMLFGDHGDDVIFGGAGRDELYGGYGQDVFRYDVGVSQTDFIIDFDITQDVVRFENGGPSSFAELMANTTQNGFDTVIDFGGGAELTIAWTIPAWLSASNFDFFS